MNGKRAADIMICCLALAIVILNCIYIEEAQIRRIVGLTGGVIFLLFLLLAVLDTDKKGKKRRRRRKYKGNFIQALALLDEDDQEISEWNIAGKVSLLIGRDTRREDVDINLRNTAFAGTVDRQHAVMNYTACRWYIEDLASANGVRIIKEKDKRSYEISKTQPCIVEKNDILLIGLARLLVK